MERSAIRRILLVVGVALLVTTAGCSALSGGDGGDGGDGASGGGYGVAGAELDGATLTDATSEAVESAGSYTLGVETEFTGTQQGTEFSATTDATTRVDLDAGQGLRERTQIQSGANQTQEVTTAVYTDGTTSYRRQETGGETSYDSQEGQSTGFGGITPVNVTGFAQNYTGIVDALAWEQDGSETVDGVTATRYTVTGVGDEEQLGTGTNTTVGNASGSMLVDGDGVVRQISITYDLESQGSTTSIEGTITLSDIGSTTVSEPDWLSNAQS